MQRRKYRALGVAGAVAAAVVLWVIGEPLLGHDMIVEQEGQEPRDLGVAEFASISLFAGLLGWGFLALLERFTSRARPIWTTVALVVLVASFLPLFVSDTSGGGKVIMALTHLAVAAALLPAFLWGAGRPANTAAPTSSVQ